MNTGWLSGGTRNEEEGHKQQAEDRNNSPLPGLTSSPGEVVRVCVGGRGSQAQLFTGETQPAGRRLTVLQVHTLSMINHSTAITLNIRTCHKKETNE